MQLSVKSDSDTFTLAAVRDILTDLSTPYANVILSALTMGDMRSALEVEFPSPNNYGHDALAFSKDYLAYNLLRKSDFIDVGVDREQQAITAFWDSEQSCSLINTYGSNPFVFDRGITTTSLAAKFHVAKGLIKDVLGKFSWDDASRRFGFSDGASTRLPKKNGSPFYKFQGKPEVTLGASVLAYVDLWLSPLWKSQFATSPNDPEYWVTKVVGSRAATVPKTWKTDRFICIEPDLNMRYQRGIGQMIRKALRKVRINLDDQTYNQVLARIGSITGALATIDLKAASDSIALALVEALLPGDWYEAILLTRSPYVLLEGKWVKLEKVSSMGNGFTFELESLIFWALAKACLITHEVEDQRLAVYGDDIVIHNSVAEPLIELLAYCGFTTNAEKTFISGPFRESCGKHYFYGADVSPFNIKSEVESEERFYWLVNSYNAWLSRNQLPHPKGAKRIYRRGRKFAKVFCVVPPGYGFDAGIETPVSKANIVWSMRKQAYIFKRMKAVRRKHRPNGPAAVLHWLSSYEGTCADRNLDSYRYTLISGCRDAVTDQVITLYKGDTIYKRFSASSSRWGDSLIA